MKVIQLELNLKSYPQKVKENTKNLKVNETPAGRIAIKIMKNRTKKKGIYK